VHPIKLPWFGSLPAVTETLDALAGRLLCLSYTGARWIADGYPNSTQRYRTLSSTGNPAISSLSAILKVMGLRMAVQPIQSP